jgi:transposase
VVDHDSGRLVWASPGRERATVHAFFDALEASGQGRCARITHVTADGAEWIADVVSNRCPTAVRCADPFYAEVRIMPMWGGLRMVTAVTASVRSA